MRLDLRCQADAFARFKSGLYQAIVVEGKKKTWDDTGSIGLRDVVLVRNCDSHARLLFDVSQTIHYLGAATLETALADVRARLGSSVDSYDVPLYLAHNERDGFLPMLYDGIHALIIRPHTKKTGEGGKYGRRNEHLLD